MKIIAGNNRGYNIIFPPNKVTRPTASIVKESLFNIIQFYINGSDFLDLFSGSGQIGLEALSRGAGHVTFVDESKYCKDCLVKNLKKMKIENNFTIVTSDVFYYLLYCQKLFDIIFLDPPYNKDLSKNVLKRVANNIKKNGIVIVETEKIEYLDENYNGLKIVKQYIYGRKKLTIYKLNNCE